jgi:serine/threonine protein kinase
VSLSNGQKLGPYEVLGLLGAGGMGEVYRARDTRLERTVAVKVLAKEFSSDPVRKQRFEREAKAISSLNLPHICVLFDVGRQDGVEFLVMECVEGETLAGSFAAGEARVLFDSHSYGVFGRYDVSADGQRFIVVYEGSHPSATLTLVTNWNAELKHP